MSSSPWVRWASLIAIAAAVATPISAARAGDVDYFKGSTKGNTVTFEHAKDRSPGAHWLLGGLLAGVAVSAGIGAYYTIDSHDVANQLGAKTLTGKTWDADAQATYDRGHRARVRAGVAYGAAGALAIAFVIALWQTDPGEESVELQPTAMVEPTAGGAIVGAAWGF